MKASGLCLALLMLTGLRCGAEPKPPFPLWTHTVAWRDSKPAGNENTNARIADATPEAIVVERGTGSLAALDARTGRELWQLNRGSDASHAYAGWSGSVIGWKLLGTARRAGRESVVLLLPQIRYQHPNMDNALEERTIQRLLCIGARSGKPIWADSGDRFETPGVSVVVVNGILAFPQSPPDYWDAATGQRLGRQVVGAGEQQIETASPPGQTQMQVERILANNPGASRLAYRPDAAAPASWLFRVANGRLEPIKAVRVGQYSYPLFVQQDRQITYVDMANDSPGSSTFPKYLIGSDLEGQRVWQFPAVLREHDYSIGAQSPDTIQQAIAIWDTPFCFAVDNTSIYGLRLRDGATVWKRARSPYYLEQRGVWKQGCFGFTSEFWTAEAAAKTDGGSANKATVSYVSAQSGKARVVLTLPFVLQAFVGGDVLYVQTAPATFRAYAIPLLMAGRSRRKGFLPPHPAHRHTERTSKQKFSRRARIV